MRYFNDLSMEDGFSWGNPVRNGDLMSLDISWGNNSETITASSVDDLIKKIGQATNYMDPRVGCGVDSLGIKTNEFLNNYITLTVNKRANDLINQGEVKLYVLKKEDSISYFAVTKSSQLQDNCPEGLAEDVYEDAKGALIVYINHIQKPFNDIELVRFAKRIKDNTQEDQSPEKIKKDIIDSLDKLIELIPSDE